jgi:putative endonuclease
MSSMSQKLPSRHMRAGSVSALFSAEPHEASEQTRIETGRRSCTVGVDMDDRHARHVYVLRSLVNPRETYIGLTSDVWRRLATHNSGGSRLTAANRPWILVVSLMFSDENRAKDFEQFLKSGSGRAFLKSHLL